MSKLYAVANSRSPFVAETKVRVIAIFRVKGGTNWYYAFEYRTDYPHRSQSIFNYTDLLGKDLFPEVVCAYFGDTDIDTINSRFFYAPVNHFEKELIIDE